jgi:hypothetical protein
MCRVALNKLKDILLKGFFAKNLMKRLIRPRSRRKPMSSVLSAQYWDTSHPNVPIRKMNKQSSLEDK